MHCILLYSVYIIHKYMCNNVITNHCLIAVIVIVKHTQNMCMCISILCISKLVVALRIVLLQYYHCFVCLFICCFVLFSSVNLSTVSLTGPCVHWLCLFRWYDCFHSQTYFLHHTSDSDLQLYMNL